MYDAVQSRVSIGAILGPMPHRFIFGGNDVSLSPKLLIEAAMNFGIDSFESAELAEILFDLDLRQVKEVFTDLDAASLNQLVKLKKTGST